MMEYIIAMLPIKIGVLIAVYLALSLTNRTMWERVLRISLWGLIALGIVAYAYLGVAANKAATAAAASATTASVTTNTAVTGATIAPENQQVPK